MIKIHLSSDNGIKKFVYEVEGEVINICTDSGTASISSTLHEVCPHCGEAECYLDCESSREALNGDQDAAEDQREDTRERARYNSTIDGVEALLLAMAGAGVDMSDLKIAESVFTAVEGIANNV